MRLPRLAVWVEVMRIVTHSPRTRIQVAQRLSWTAVGLAGIGAVLMQLAPLVMSVWVPIGFIIASLAASLVGLWFIQREYEEEDHHTTPS